METLLTYLLKSAALLGIFFLVYQLLLQNDTHFQVNRRFLLTGILAALILPAITFTRIVPMQSASLPLELLPAGGEYSPLPTASVDWWQLAGVVYGIGLLFFLLRFLLQLISLLKLLQGGTRHREGSYIMITSDKPLLPFSFFLTIVYNPSLHSEEELQIILRHEKVHASQWHSADVLLVNLTTALLWFNPFSWGYKNSLTQNLEYIADQETVASAVPRKEYQHSLLRISVRGYQPVLANNFYQSLIKKRILMLNKKPTPNFSFWKVSTVFPLVLVFMFFFNLNTVAQSSPVVEKTSAKTPEVAQQTRSVTIVKTSSKKTDPIVVQTRFQDSIQPIYIVNGELKDASFDVSSIDPDNIAVINVVKGEQAVKVYGNKGENGVIHINLKTIGDNAEIDPEQNFQPLIVLDGKIMKTDYDYNVIDPNTIESIDVLKGKSAVQKYGAEASGGVIEIRLKKE